MVQKILQRSDIKPFKIKYYCEKRDPDFESKMHDVLVVYKQVSMQFDENGKIIIPTDEPMVHTISCDEKPGIQAIATTGFDLRPTKGNGCVMRDAEYKRLGTLSLLAGIDLLTGEAIPIVSETHKSSDFINLLKKLNKNTQKVISFELFATIILPISQRKLETFLQHVRKDVLYLCLHPSMVHGST